MSRARSVADLGNQNVLSVSATNGNINVGTGVTLENTGEAQFSGIVTAPSIDTRNLIGNVSIGGVLTYEDVTSVDSVGIVTAGDGLRVTDGGLVVTAGVSTFAGITTVTGETLFTKQLNVSGVSTLGDARVTGILTVGTASITLDGTTGNVSGASLHDTQVSAISKDITDSAVDVFVYDTRKDSDGGAWRKRTQDKSWYIEDLGTATRGTRKEFPAVAVIVAESNPNKVTIYDGDDPDLPMWMVFTASTSSTSNFLAVSGQTLSSIFMLNGDLCIGFPSANGWGLGRVNFLSDSQGWYWTSANIYRQVKNSIAERNIESGYYDSGSGISGLGNARINDVAMTVLPNAPIDSATGLPIPTIVVATESGASLIKDDGTVFDAADNALRSVDFNDEYRVISTRKATGSQTARFFVSQPVNTVSSDSSWLYDYFTGNFSAGHPRLRLDDTGAGVVSALQGDTCARGSNIGFTLWNVNNEDELSTGGNYTNSLLCGISTSYNTGWMHGDIKGAFLSDTDTTNTAVAYSDGFSNNDNGWAFAAASGSGGSVTGGNLVLTQNSQARAYDVDALDGIAAGTKLVFTFTVGGSGTGTFDIDDDGAGAGVGGNTVYGSFSSTGSHIFTATKTASNRIRFYRQNGSNDYEFAFLNITTEYDRSVNDKGLTSNGTVNKSVVATGASLVGYGPFSNANYVKQLYNSDMDFGTGDMSVTWWHYMIGDVSNAEYVYDRAGASGNRHAVYYVTNDNGRMTFYTNSGSSQTSEVYVNGINAYKDKWTCYTVTRSGSSGDMAIYIDGEVGYYAPSMVVRDMDNTSAELYIGVRHNETAAAAQAKFALMRFSKSVPSPEQIKKIYEDEKVLFQENAKATLYGSSDAVTALGHDEDTELLHVGTSSGRSEFQGLCRINNTTDAVTAAISASNDLVAEK